MNSNTLSPGTSSDVSTDSTLEIIIENLAVHHEGRTLSSMNVIARLGPYSFKFIGVTIVAKERGVTIDFPWTNKKGRWEPVVDANQAIRRPMAVAILKAYHDAIPKQDRELRLHADSLKADDASRQDERIYTGGTSCR